MRCEIKKQTKKFTLIFFGFIRIESNALKKLVLYSTMTIQKSQKLLLAMFSVVAITVVTSGNILN